MANKVFSFSGQADFINQSLSSSQDVVPNDVFIDVNAVSMPIQKIDIDGNTVYDYKISNSSNVQAILNSLHNIFSWYQGERILLPEFGSRLRMLLYEGITPYTEQQIVSEIRGTVSEWDPRIQIVDVKDTTTNDDVEDNTIRIDVVFSIPQLDDQLYSYSFKFNRPN